MKSKGKHPHEKEHKHSFQIEWFERMDGAVSWRIQEPDFVSPFKPQFDDVQLALFARSTEALKRIYTIKCLCGGYEILQVKNLAAFNITTDHPCLTGIKPQDLKNYLKGVGILEELIESMHAVQKILREQIKLLPTASIVQGNDLIDKIKKEAEKKKLSPEGKSHNKVRTIRK